MEKIKRVQSKQQQKKLLKDFNLQLDLKKDLKNIINKDSQYTIPIFIPHMGCKNECVFCNQKKITGITSEVTVNDVEKIIINYLKYFKNNKNNKKIEIAFFGGSFTGLPVHEQISYLEVANKYVLNNEVDSIRLSTRPDYISPKILKVLKMYNVSTIELGVQSMNNNILALSKRGHDTNDVIRAARLISIYKMNLGIQIMVGLPGSTEKTEIETIKKVLKLNPVCLRIYPVYVLKQSKLYDMYLKGQYIPLTLEDATRRTYLVLKECIKTDVKVIRIGLQSTNEITASNSQIVGPVCDNFAEYALSRIVLKTIESKIKNLNYNKSIGANVTFSIPNKYVSICIGPKKVNKQFIKQKYNINLKVKGEI